MARKQRVDSIAGAVQVLAKAARPLHIPEHVPLDPQDLPFWNSVLAEFARSEWTDHQLELAAMLARTMADLEREQVALREEGSVMRTDKGTPVVNPRKTVIQMHAGTILNFRRSLSLNVKLDMQKIAATRGQAKEIEAAAEQAVGDDLIPKLRAV